MESEDFLNQPGLSEIQYHVVEAMSQIYYEKDLIRLMGDKAGSEYYKTYTKKEIILSLGKGSIVGSDEVYDPTTGKWHAIESLMEQPDQMVQGYDGNSAIVQNGTEAWCEGFSEVFKVDIERGLSITVSPDHKFYNRNHERVPLKDLRIGDRIAVAAKTECTNPVRIPEDEPFVLGLWLGDGMMPIDENGRRNINVDFADTDAIAMQKYTDILDKHGDKYYLKRSPNGKKMSYVRSGRPNAQWSYGLAEKHGLIGKRAHDKVIPDAVWSLPNDQLAEFLGALWGTDGTVYLKKNGANKTPRWVLEYTTISEDLAVGIQRLLTRFGVLASLRSRIPTYIYNGEKREGQRAYYLTIYDAEGFMRFANNISLPDKQHLVDKGIQQHCLIKSQSHYDGDVFYARIRKVTKEVMPKPVYTMTAVDTKNFVANLVLNGNSGK